MTTDQPDVAALQRAVDTGRADLYISGGTGRIEFTDADFQAWYLAERAEIERQVRAKVAQEILDTQQRHEETYHPPGRPDGVMRWLERRAQAKRDAEIARGGA